MIVVSPHLDDAVLSLGQFLAAHPARVTTVFAGVPTEGCSDYDRSCGFASSQEAMTARRAEDDEATCLLGCVNEHLDYFDAQYGDTRDGDALIEWLHTQIVRPVHVCVPLGLGHPDHRFVANAARLACTAGELLLYEELPYKVMWPEQVFPALELFRADGFTVEPYATDVGDRDLKRKAIECYRSQFPTADDPCLSVPERVWRATRCV